eukprot:SAG31_NODE_15623_length_746_cov_0.947450_1_plen_40_part_10
MTQDVIFEMRELIDCCIVEPTSQFGCATAEHNFVSIRYNF